MPNIPPVPTRIDTTRADWKTIVEIMNTVREQAYKDGYADGYNKGTHDKDKRFCSQCKVFHVVNSEIGRRHYESMC